MGAEPRSSKVLFPKPLELTLLVRSFVRSFTFKLVFTFSCWTYRWRDHRWYRYRSAGRRVLVVVGRKQTKSESLSFVRHATTSCFWVRVQFEKREGLGRV